MYEEEEEVKYHAQCVHRHTYVDCEFDDNPVLKISTCNLVDIHIQYIYIYNATLYHKTSTHNVNAKLYSIRLSSINSNVYIAMNSNT